MQADQDNDSQKGESLSSSLDASRNERNSNSGKRDLRPTASESPNKQNNNNLDNDADTHSEHTDDPGRILLKQNSHDLR